MKKIATLSIAVLSALTLAACGNSSSKGADTVNTTTTKKATPAKKVNNKKTGQEVTNGSPVKVGQWKYYEDFNANGTLVKIAKINKEVKQGDMSIKLDSVKIYSMKPKNDAAKKTAADYFDVSGVTDPYYVLQLIWSAKNNGSQELQTNGIESIVVVSSGQQLSMGNGLMDSGLGSSLLGSGSQDFEADGLLNNGEFEKINKLTVKIGSVADTSTFDDVSPETTVELNF